MYSNRRRASTESGGGQSTTTVAALPRFRARASSHNNSNTPVSAGSVRNPASGMDSVRGSEKETLPKIRTRSHVEKPSSLRSCSPSRSPSSPMQNIVDESSALPRFTTRPSSRRYVSTAQSDGPAEQTPERRSSSQVPTPRLSSTLPAAPLPKLSARGSGFVRAPNALAAARGNTSDTMFNGQPTSLVTTRQSRTRSPFANYSSSTGQGNVSDYESFLPRFDWVPPEAKGVARKPLPVEIKIEDESPFKGIRQNRNDIGEDVALHDYLGGRIPDDFKDSNTKYNYIWYNGIPSSSAEEEAMLEAAVTTDMNSMPDKDIVNVTTLRYSHPGYGMPRHLQPSNEALFPVARFQYGIMGKDAGGKIYEPGSRGAKCFRGWDKGTGNIEDAFAIVQKKYEQFFAENPDKHPKCVEFIVQLPRIDDRVCAPDIAKDSPHWDVIMLVTWDRADEEHPPVSPSTRRGLDIGVHYSDLALAPAPAEPRLRMMESQLNARLENLWQHGAKIQGWSQTYHNGRENPGGRELQLWRGQTAAAFMYEVDEKDMRPGRHPKHHIKMAHGRGMFPIRTEQALPFAESLNRMLWDPVYGSPNHTVVDFFSMWFRDSVHSHVQVGATLFREPQPGDKLAKELMLRPEITVDGLGRDDTGKTQLYEDDLRDARGKKQKNENGEPIKVQKLMTEWSTAKPKNNHQMSARVQGASRTSRYLNPFHRVHREKIYWDYDNFTGPVVGHQGAHGWVMQLIERDPYAHDLYRAMQSFEDS